LCTSSILFSSILKLLSLFPLILATLFCPNQSANRQFFLQSINHFSTSNTSDH
jgi:hypothetical protein